jgi:peptidylprolyl isomerase
MMPLQKGDFILIDYTAKVKETNEVFDTTNEEISKKDYLYKEGEIYEPKLIVIGEGWMLKPLDDAFANMEPTEPATVEIPSDKANNRGTHRVWRKNGDCSLHRRWKGAFGF